VCAKGIASSETIGGEGVAEEFVFAHVPILIEAILPLNKKFLIANGKCPGEGPLVQTGKITAPRLSSPFNALADRVGRSGSHPPSIEAPVGQNRGRLQNPAKARLVVIIIRLCRGEAALRKIRNFNHGT